MVSTSSRHSVQRFSVKQAIVTWLAINRDSVAYEHTQSGDLLDGRRRASRRYCWTYPLRKGYEPVDTLATWIAKVEDGAVPHPSCLQEQTT